MEKQMMSMEELEQVVGGMVVVNKDKRDGRSYRNVKENLDNFVDDVKDGVTYVGVKVVEGANWLWNGIKSIF